MSPPGKRSKAKAGIEPRSASLEADAIVRNVSLTWSQLKADIQQCHWTLWGQHSVCRGVHRAVFADKVDMVACQNHENFSMVPPAPPALLSTSGRLAYQWLVTFADSPQLTCGDT